VRSALTIGLLSLALVLASFVPASAAATMTGYTITGSSPAVGKTATFVPKAQMSDGSTLVFDPTWVQWSSANPAVATWVAPGVLQGVSAGTVVVTSTYAGVWVATATVTVTDGRPTMTGYKITGTAPKYGATATFTPIALMSDGSTLVFDPTWVQWTSPNPAVATWVSPGVLQGVGPGSVVVQSTYAEFVATASVTIDAPAPPPAIACAANQTATSKDGQPVAVAYPAPVVTGGLAPVSTTCTPASGSSFALGTTPVTCTAVDSLQRAASCTGTVTVADGRPTMTGYKITGTAPKYGETATFTPTALMSDGSTLVFDPTWVQWTTANAAVASWVSPGVLKGVAPGTVTVTSTYREFTATATVTIAAPAPPPAIACAANQTASSKDGQPVAVTYPAPTVTGGLAPVSTTCTPASGSSFALGATPVTCTAVDSLQRAASCTGTVTVADARPTMTGYTITGSGPAVGDTATFVPKAQMSDGSTITFDPTWVTWTTANAALAQWTAPGVLKGVAAGTVVVTSTYREFVATQTVTITPPATPPPALSCPANQTAASANGQPVAVSFPAPTVTGGLAPVSTVCSPASGSSFGVGSTSVTCTATDSLQRVNSCQFSVTVAKQQATVASLTISGTAPAAGADAPFTVQAQMSDGSTLSVDPSWATWDTDNAAVAAWTAPGMLHGVGAGTTRVVANWYGAVGTKTLTIVAPKTGSVRIDWDANSPSENVTGYELAYGTTPGAYTTTLNVGNVTSYVVSGLTPNTTYYFTIRAFNGGWSQYSPDTLFVQP